MFLPLLYKVDSKGKVRTISMEILGDEYRTISGIEDGAKTTSKWTTAKPKNVGKANATTSEAQAVKEAQAKWNNKLTQHYSASKEEALTGGRHFFEVMLATESEKVDLRALIKKYGYLLQDPKLDGMRMVTERDSCFTRKGKPINTAHWITDDLKPFFKANPSITLDGELYNHKYKDNFEKIISLAKRNSLTPLQDAEVRDHLEYHVYDMFDSENPNMSADERKEWLKENLDHGIFRPRVKVVRHKIVYSYDDLLEEDKNNLALGYEGSVVRVPSAVYKAGRGKNMFKVKQFITEEFTIIDVLAGKGNRSGIAGKLIIDVDGAEVGCSILGSWDYCDKLYKTRNNVIGKDATIRYFNKTTDGSLRFPVCIDIDRWSYE